MEYEDWCVLAFVSDGEVEESAGYRLKPLYVDRMLKVVAVILVDLKILDAITREVLQTFTWKERNCFTHILTGILHHHHLVIRNPQGLGIVSNALERVMFWFDVEKSNLLRSTWESLLLRHSPPTNPLTCITSRFSLQTPLQNLYASESLSVCEPSPSLTRVFLDLIHVEDGEVRINGGLAMVEVKDFISPLLLHRVLNSMDEFKRVVFDADYEMFVVCGFDGLGLCSIALRFHLLVHLDVGAIVHLLSHSTDTRPHPPPSHLRDSANQNCWTQHLRRSYVSPCRTTSLDVLATCQNSRPSSSLVRHLFPCNLSTDFAHKFVSLLATYSLHPPLLSPSHHRHHPIIRGTDSVSGSTNYRLTSSYSRSTCENLSATFPPLAPHSPTTTTIRNALGWRTCSHSTVTFR